MTEVARQNGVSPQGLRNWVNQDRADRGQEAVRGLPAGPDQSESLRVEHGQDDARHPRCLFSKTLGGELRDGSGVWRMPLRLAQYETRKAN